jgi:hypothetical protein
MNDEADIALGGIILTETSTNLMDATTSYLLADKVGMVRALSC